MLGKCGSRRTNITMAIKGRARGFFDNLLKLPSVERTAKMKNVHVSMTII